MDINTPDPDAPFNGSIDADNHYYETLDAFTRHLDKKFKDRGVKPVQDGKHVQLLMGGKVNRFIPNPTFDPIIVPGCLDPLFRGRYPDDVLADTAHLGLLDHVRAQDVFNEVVASEYMPGVQCHELQQTVLGCRQPHLPPVAGNLATVSVDGKPSMP